ncbi:FecR domain-containing protein [Candidatus Peregrinibacteria bacterium]|nr:FecR domain-containing protein [Candidatus Peregrinibacteria bacterium]
MKWFFFHHRNNESFEGVRRFLENEKSRVIPDERFLSESRKRLKLMIQFSKKQNSAEIPAGLFFAPLLAFLKQCVLRTELTCSSRVRMKETLMERFDASLVHSFKESLHFRFRNCVFQRFLTRKIRAFMQQILNDMQFFFGKKRVWAFIFTSVFFIVIIFPTFLSNTDNHLAYAIYIKPMGKILVQRDGKNIVTESDIFLYEGDTVITPRHTSAEIYFSNKGVSRLDEETEVALFSLDIDEYQPKEARIEVEIKKGRVWSNVFDMNHDAGNFVVKSSDMITEVDSKASFDVAVNPNGVLVTAASNTVDLKVQQNDGVIQKVLVEGQKFEIKNKEHDYSERLVFLDALIKDQWIDSNIVKDKVYEQKVKEEYQIALREKTGLLPGHFFYPVKKLTENAKLALTFNPVEREKQMVSIAEMRLMEAEILFSSGENDKADNAIQEFKDTVFEVSNDLDDIRAKNENSGESLNKTFQENLKEHANSFPFGTNEVSHVKAKESVIAAFVENVDDPKERSDFQFRYAHDTLLEIRDFLKTKNQDDAKILAQFTRYRSAAQDSLDGFYKLTKDDKVSIIQNVIDYKIREFLTLKVLEKSFLSDSISEKIYRLKVNLLWDINMLVLSYEDALKQEIAQVLLEQRNDEFVQKSILRGLKKMVQDENVRIQLDRFEKLTLSSTAFEILKGGEEVKIRFSDSVFIDSRTATSQIDVW